MLTVLAPAKLNLTLEVLAKRRNGFHQICSVIQTINLQDSLRFRLSRDVTFKSTMPDWLPEESLVSEAVSLLKEASGCSKGARIEISKRIPLVAGLGGDSSDAAATLHGLNKLWELGLSQKELVELAGQLGSDVAFFVYGGTALVEGRGEVVTRLPPLSHMWVILVFPPVPRVLRKTEQLYASLKTAHYTDGQITKKLVAQIRGSRQFTSSLLFNAFENVAFTRLSQISVYREHMMKIGAIDVHLAGSGPTLFTLVRDKAQAKKLYTRLQRQKMRPYLAETLATIDQIE